MRAAEAGKCLSVCKARATSGAARSAIKTVLAHLGGDAAVDAAAADAAFNDAFHGADFAEGAAAFLAKRAPHFAGGNA